MPVLCFCVDALKRHASGVELWCHLIICCMCCRFECKSDGSYLQIMHVSLEKTDEDPDESAFTGPVSCAPAANPCQTLSLI